MTRPRIDVITIFPAMIEAPTRDGIVGRAAEKGLVEIHAHDLRAFTDDRGRVIGRQGRTADALRTLLEAVGRRRGIECDMEVVD